MSKAKVILLRTVSRPVCLGVSHTSEANDQISISVRQLAELLMWGTLSDKRFCSLQLLLGLASAVYWGRGGGPSPSEIMTTI
jgi:hypothetical protein